MSSRTNKTRAARKICCRTPIQQGLLIFIISVEKYQHFLLPCILWKERLYNIDEEAKGRLNFVSSPLTVGWKVGNRK